MPRLFGLTDKPKVEGGKLAPLEAYGVKIMSMGFLVDENVPMVWRGPMVSQAISQMLGEVAWGELDALVIDMPPGTGDVQLTIAQQVPLAGAVIVSTPQDLALIDARRAVAMFQKVEAPILGVIENMSYFLCPHCGGRSEIFAHGGARHDAEQMGVPFLGEAPLDIKIRQTSDAGSPVVGRRARQPAGRGLSQSRGEGENAARNAEAARCAKDRRRLRRRRKKNAPPLGRRARRADRRRPSGSAMFQK